MSKTTSTKNPKLQKPIAIANSVPDPRQPLFRHYQESDECNNMPWAHSAAEFLSFFGHQHLTAHLRVKRTWSPLNEIFQRVRLDDHLIHDLTSCMPEDENIFFCPVAVGFEEPKSLTWFGWCDTGSVHPGIYHPHPAAYWETSKGQYQAVWRWDKGIPIAASTARIEALIHEFGGKLGTHLPSSFLRVPGTINHSAACFPWPIIRLLYNELDDAIDEAKNEKISRLYA